MDITYRRIRELRILRGMTQAELAEKTGYTTRSSINRIEAGQVDIPTSKINLFATALGTTPSYLLGLDIKSNTAAENSASKSKLIRAIDSLSDDQIEKVLTFIDMIK